jgi:hypothetical protein
VIFSCFVSEKGKKNNVNSVEKMIEKAGFILSMQGGR